MTLDFYIADQGRNVNLVKILLLTLTLQNSPSRNIKEKVQVSESAPGTLLMSRVTKLQDGLKEGAIAQWLELLPGSPVAQEGPGSRLRPGSPVSLGKKLNLYFLLFRMRV